MSTSSSRAAFTAPACTLFQNSCVVPLGMTAILSRPGAFGALPDADSEREQAKFVSPDNPSASNNRRRMSATHITTRAAGGGPIPRTRAINNAAPCASRCDLVLLLRGVLGQEARGVEQRGLFWGLALASTCRVSGGPSARPPHVRRGRYPGWRPLPCAKPPNACFSCCRTCRRRAPC